MPSDVRVVPAEEEEEEEEEEKEGEEIKFDPIFYSTHGICIMSGREDLFNPLAASNRCSKSSIGRFGCPPPLSVF